MLRMNLVLAAIAVVLAIPTWWTLRHDRVTFVDVDDVPLLFRGFTPEHVTTVTVSRAARDPNGAAVRDDQGQLVTDEIRLVRTDVDDRSRWALGGEDPLAGVAVDGAKVQDRVLAHLAAIRRAGDALVEEGAAPDSLERYGLDEASATRIRCFDPSGNVVADLFRGDDASRGRVGEDVVRGYFVRAADSTDVLLYEESYWVIDVERAAWVEKRVLPFALDRAVEVTLKNPKGTMTVVCPDLQAERWEARRAPDGVGPVRNTEVRALLQSLAGLRVEQFVEALPADPDLRRQLLAEHGLDEPRVTAEVVVDDGARFRLEVGGKVAGQNTYWALAEGVPFLVWIGDWVLGPFERNPRAFFDPPR